MTPAGLNFDTGEWHIPTPRWAVPLLKPARYKGAKGGRGGGKGYFFADLLIEDCLSVRGTLACCLREIQRTLAESSKRLLESRMEFLGVASQFKVFEDCIETPGGGLVIFRGMQSFNAENIKSLEGYRRFWWDEAQNASAESLKILRPTPRATGAEMWFSWNPKDPPDAKNPMNSIDGLFSQAASLPGGGVLVECNFEDNPWLPDDLAKEEEWDRLNRAPEEYQHIWRGAYLVRSEARVFKNWRVEAFDTPAIGAAFMFGGDFGFAVDPSVLVRCWIARQEGGRYIPDTNGRFLMIDQEAYRVGCDVDFTPALFGGDTVAGPNNAWRNQNPFGFPGIPEATRWPIIADSARPETISYLQRHGFPQVKAAKKGPGSVEEGIEFLKAYTIVIHPRCEHTQREFTVYSFKIDQKTGLVLPVLVDKENHVIDSVRYAVEDVRRGRGFFG